jgi:hypothetical protein
MINNLCLRRQRVEQMTTKRFEECLVFTQQERNEKGNGCYRMGEEEAELQMDLGTEIYDLWTMDLAAVPL